MGHGTQEASLESLVARIGQIGGGLVRQQEVADEIHADFAFALQHALRQHVRHEPAQAKGYDGNHPEAAEGKTSSQIQGWACGLWVHGAIFLDMSPHYHQLNFLNQAPPKNLPTHRGEVGLDLSLPSCSINGRGRESSTSLPKWIAT